MLLCIIYPVNFSIASILVLSGTLILNIYWWIRKIMKYFKKPAIQLNYRNRNINQGNIIRFLVGNNNNRNSRFRRNEHSKFFWSIEKYVEKIFNCILHVLILILVNLCYGLKYVINWIFTNLSELRANEVNYEPTSEDESDWSALGNYGVPLLPIYDMKASIDEISNKNKIRAPKNKTKFLKEIGYFSSASRGTDKTFNNSIILSMTKTLRDDVPEITAWKATPTTAKSIARMIQTKIDRAPKEQHQHWNRLEMAYRTFAKWMTSIKCDLKRLSNDEVIKSINLSSSMGMQEEIIKIGNTSLKFESLKDYVEYKNSNGQYLWQERVEMFRRSLEDEKPILGIFNAVAKAEKKNKNFDRANRLIWYLPATARIFEAQVFGGLEDILRKLPYSVSGIPLYDYGEKLADILHQNNRKAICNDISGWDTRISYGLLCLEANFLRSITKDESMKTDITNLYRLYANAHVMIARNGGLSNETAIYKLRGQVASGRRTTYVMNTITNTIVSMCAAAYSYGISDYDFERWMLNCLYNGHTDDFGGKISGDDSVLIFGAEQAVKYSKYAHKFLNEIGLPRKGLELNEESHIISRMEDIEFCSNKFVKVKYGSNGIERWMPVKPVEVIFGKACIMLEKPKDSQTEEAWARIQGLNLLFCYHHIPEVKALALALLSCTSKKLSLESLLTGWKQLDKDCLNMNDLFKNIDRRLFGKSTTVKKFRGSEEKVVENWSDLGELDRQGRSRNGSISDEVLQTWYRTIPLKIQELRKHNQNHLYEDWNNNMKEIKNEGEKLDFIKDLWKVVRNWF